MDEKVMQHVAESAVNQLKQELTGKLENSLRERREEEREELFGAIHEKINQIQLDENAKILEDLEEEHRKKLKSFLDNRRNTKDDLENSSDKVISEAMSRVWESSVTEQIENKTEELELFLWNEMSATLQQAYRLNRNTSSQLKVNKQASLDNVENRLESQIFQLNKTNVIRLQHMKSTLHATFEEELQNRTERMKLDIELEMKTLQRELDQLKQNAEANQTASSTFCNLL